LPGVPCATLATGRRFCSRAAGESTRQTRTLAHSHAVDARNARANLERWGNSLPNLGLHFVIPPPPPQPPRTWPCSLRFGPIWCRGISRHPRPKLLLLSAMRCSAPVSFIHRSLIHQPKIHFSHIHHSAIHRSLIHCSHRRPSHHLCADRTPSQKRRPVARRTSVCFLVFLVSQYLRQMVAKQPGLQSAWLSVESVSVLAELMAARAAGGLCERGTR
jgi:hypothetical protein